MKIKAGDKCWVRASKKHYGICTGHGVDREPWFVHNTPEFGVVHTTRKDFSGHRPVHVEWRPDAEQQTDVVERALSLVGGRYDLLFFNCEHVANVAAHDVPTSRQVQTGVIAAAGLALVGLFAANENGTAVDAQGYRRDHEGRFASRRWW